MQEKIRVGLIGAGRIGRLHAENLKTRLPDSDLVAVAEVAPGAGEDCAKRFQIPCVHIDHREILDNPDVDAVIICSSTDTHAQMIVEAADAGKHIFCEKPIDFDLRRIDETLEAVDRAGVKLQVGFNRRFDPSFRKARDSVASGKVGRPHLLRITSRDPEPPPMEYVKVSGGIFLDMTIHDFDMARYMMGEEVVEIYASGGVLVDPQIGDAGDVDTCIITLRFDSGALGCIDNSRKAVYGYDQRVEVFGELGMVTVANPTPDMVAFSGETNVSTSLPLYFFVERYNDSYLQEMKTFIDCILRDLPCPVTGVDGRIPVAMGLAARKSLQENRPVRIEEVA